MKIFELFKKLFEFEDKKATKEIQKTPSTEILSIQEILSAIQWFREHSQHVNSLIDSAYVGYPPKLSEDKRDPKLWKPAHWLWFKLNDEQMLKAVRSEKLKTKK